MKGRVSGIKYCVQKKSINLNIYKGDILMRKIGIIFFVAVGLMLNVGKSYGEKIEVDLELIRK